MNTPIDISEEAGVRYLHFGSDWVQGAMRIRKPDALELAYTREMMAGLLLRDGLAEDTGRWPKKVLIIGLGAASLAKFVYRHCPQARIRVVEIAPTVVAAARQFFKLPAEDARFSIHVGCGAQYVLEKDETWDYILVDGFDRNARAGALDTLPFYQAVRSRLSGQGLMAVNLFGRSRGYKASVERLLKAFDDRVVAFPSCDSGNVVAFAADGEAIERPLAELRERARLLKTTTGLDLGPTITRLEQSGSVPGGSLRL
ncbi:spermidine synthase [Thauera butanivorans]|uniref:spermine/spermidine synthase domain-containing protein n=1 Tax=Thauera butanivorans TaxID=86174 RepID=UPI00083923CB|nr:spermidine synthase [Thauera butanivorans]